MASLVKHEADEMIAKEQDGKNLKYEYTANANVLTGKLKDNLILYHSRGKSKRRKKLYKQMLDEIKRIGIHKTR